MHYYHQPCQPDELIGKLKTNLAGTEFIDVTAFLTEMGFTVYPFIEKAEKISQFIRHKYPLLVSFCRDDYMHTCIVYGCRLNEDGSPESLYIYNPASGKKEYPFPVLDTGGPYKIFSNNALYLLILKQDDPFNNHTLVEGIFNNPFYHNLTGEYLYFSRKKYGEAVQSWEKALRLKAGYAEVYNNLAIYYLEQTGDYAKAENLTYKACELDSTDITFRLTLGEIYLKMKKKDPFFSIIKFMEKKWKKNIDVLKLKRRGTNEFK